MAMDYSVPLENTLTLRITMEKVHQVLWRMDRRVTATLLLREMQEGLTGCQEIRVDIDSQTDWRQK